MIDTDKYEGHTEGPWWFVEDWAEHPTKPVFVIRAHENEELVVHRSEWMPNKKVDWMLMADAPDLLAEVKRLREGINEVLNECWPNATAMMRKLKEMIE